MTLKMHGGNQQAEEWQQTQSIGKMNMTIEVTGDKNQSGEQHQGILSGTKIYFPEIFIHVIILGTKQ